MDDFNYQNGSLYAESVAVSELAQSYGTPCYIYSRATLLRHWKAFDNAFGEHPHQVCYAVKANSNIGILNLFARMGSGFDIVSGGELARVLAAGGDPKKVVFSGVGKSHAEMTQALQAGIGCFNLESIAEMQRLNEVAAELNIPASVSLRVNPDVDAKTHPYISTGLKENKFGIDINDAIDVYKQADQLSYLNIIGVDCHIGSQLTELRPFLDAMDRLLLLIDTLAEQGIQIKHLDIGGGLGVRYADETPPEPAEYAKAIINKLGDRKLAIYIEPGRAIAANAGILVTRVEYLKPTEAKNFAIVDAAMNDLIRPALYQAEQEIIEVEKTADRDTDNWDIVGPICETGDFLGKNRSLAIQAGDLLAIRSSGAYGFTMSSNYNTRPRAVEIMVDGDKTHIIRQRESIDSLFENESLLPD